MVGFIFLHRDLLEWEWYQSSEVSRLYIHLLLKANYTDKKWQGNEVKRGQFSKPLSIRIKTFCSTNKNFN